MLSGKNGQKSLKYCWTWMSKTKPTIGVTRPERGGAAAWWFLKLGIWLQGGKAVRITTETGYTLDDLDGLILGGGADVDPEHYGQQREGSTQNTLSKPRSIWQYLIRVLSLLLYPLIYIVRKVFATRSQTIDRERDDMELYILEKALEYRLPVLGICRGAQLINVKLGGTLHQDITGFYGEVPHVHSILPKKQIKVKPGSTLYEIFESSVITVNALHHQAIDKLAPSLDVVAREQSGIVQAVESPDYPFLIGVQWHPEYLPQIEAQRNIFRAFVKAACSVIND